MTSSIAEGVETHLTEKTEEPTTNATGTVAPIAEAEALIEQAMTASKVDNQSNQLNEDGTLKLECFHLSTR